jgi:hypothetical protein
MAYARAHMQLQKLGKSPANCLEEFARDGCVCRKEARDET